MSESTLSPAYADLRADIGWLLGYTRTSGSWSADQILDIEDCLLSGLRQFFFPPAPFAGYRWNFFRPITTLTTSAPYSTGTVTVVDGVVTLASGTFPTWAAAGVFVYSNNVYEINTRDSGTQITLVDLPLDVSAGASYEVNQQDYDLDDDFGYVNGDLTYAPELSWPPIKPTNDSDIRRMRQLSSQTDRPLWYAVRPKAATLTTGQRFEMLFYPTPDEALRITFPYQPLPGKLTSTNIYTYGGMQHGETLLESCLAIAEQRMNDVAGLHTQKFMERLSASVEVDKRLLPPNMGYNGDRSDRSRATWERAPSSGYATYGGALYTG